MSFEPAVAAHSFGLGARPGEIAEAGGDPRAWLLGQLETPPPQPKPVDGGSFGSGRDLVVDYLKLLKLQKDPRALLAAFEIHKQNYLREMGARLALGIATKKPFAERLVWFWSNHFTVSAQDPRALALVGAFEREAIRPHIAGSFEDMLLAVVRHPGMQLYLDNARSIGPHSFAGRFAGLGLNENLGRELMELHTLGVDGGYTQADVIALANLLTGWSVDRDGGGDDSTGFRYFPARHEPGSVVLRGKTYSGGEEAAIAALKDLAHDPATARHVARRFAAHFIADEPPPDSVRRLETVFQQTNGNLKALAAAAVDDPLAWSPAKKVRSPIEYVTAAMRFIGWPHGGDMDRQVKGLMAGVRLMGQFPLAAPSPKGWPDDSQSWSGPDAVLNRIQWAREVGNRIPKEVDAVAAAEQGLGPLLQPATRAAMKSASGPGEAVALLLSSPEFQRR